MPKIRCKSCEATLNVPEKALGKTIKCPKCSNKIKVPSGGSGGASPQQQRRKKKPVKSAAADDPFGLGNLDDYDLEDKDEQICPYCAKDIDEDDVICQSCGMNLETGQMDRREKKKRSRKGPDPSKFFAAAFPESWKFVLSEPRMAIRVGTGFTFFTTLALMCGYMGFVYVQEQMPPKVFWIMLSLLCGLSVPGLMWYLTLKIVDSTRRNDKFQSDRIQFDLFTSIAAGVRAFFWPLILIPGAPVILAGGVVYSLLFSGDLSNPAFLIVGGGLLGFALFLLPMAMVHMTARYTYKGWILWELLQILFQNLVGIIYMHLVAFVALIPALLVAVPILLVIKGDGGFESMNPFGSGVVNGITAGITTWFLNIVGMNPDPEGGMFTIIRAMLNIAAAFIVIAPIGYLSAFPAIFVMKACGLFGYYHSSTLGLVDQKREYEIATFWVRYLGHIIDNLCAPLAVFLVSSNAKLSKVAWVFTGFVVLSFIFAKVAFPGMLVLWLVYSNWMYWVVQEASEIRTTLGKDAFGLIVITEDNEQLTMKQATMKWFLRNVSDNFAGIPFLFAAIPPKKQALHDMATKTKVVWKGDR